MEQWEKRRKILELREKIQRKDTTELKDRNFRRTSKDKDSLQTAKV